MADLDSLDLSSLFLEEANLESLDHSTLVLEIAKRVEQIGSLAALRTASRSLLTVCDEATTTICLKGGPGNGALMKRLWNLTRLHADSSSKLEETMALIPLAVHGKLLHIQLKNNLHLTTVEALGGCKALETLHLSCCKQLTSVEGLEGCKALQILDLSGCSPLTSVEGLGEGVRIIR